MLAKPSVERSKYAKTSFADMVANSLIELIDGSYSNRH